MRSSPPLSLSLFNDMHIQVFITIMIYSWVYKMRLGIYIHSPSSIFHGRHIPCMALCSCLAGGWLLVNSVHRLVVVCRALGHHADLVDGLGWRS